MQTDNWSIYNTAALMHSTWQRKRKKEKKKTNFRRLHPPNHFEIKRITSLKYSLILSIHLKINYFFYQSKYLGGFPEIEFAGNSGDWPWMLCLRNKPEPNTRIEENIGNSLELYYQIKWRIQNTWSDCWMSKNALKYDENTLLFKTISGECFL